MASEPGGSFSEKVRYIYLKQLEEADLIVINKNDLLAPVKIDALASALAQQFPGRRILAVSSRLNTGLEDWFNLLLGGSQPGGEAMSVDYRTYAEGEALLGWLNCTVKLSSPKGFDGNSILRELASMIQAGLNHAGAEVAHLKMTLSPDYGLGDIAVVNLVRSDFVPELSVELPEPVDSGQLIVNIRAESDPDDLYRLVSEALTTLARNHPGFLARLEHEEHFRPGEPRPTHRLAAFSIP